MKKLAIVDLDGVIANSKKRFEIATKNGKIDWSIAFNPEHIKLDEMMPGAKESLQQLHKHGYTVIYLTSRPEQLAMQSQIWLNDYGISGPESFYKPEADKYIKTTLWKATVVRELTRRNQYTHFIFIDDEPANRQAVEDLKLHNIVCQESLDMALEYIYMQEATEHEKSA
jgi:ribonucleotide monophosphatase NagD (HAD superfamily)